MSSVDSTTAVEYRPIPGFVGYVACSDGSVWSCFKSVGRRAGQSRGGGGWIDSGQPRRKLKPQTIKPTIRYPRNKPYQWVCLQNSGRKRIAFVHILVLEAFVGLCPEGMECRHLDGNVSHNWLGNLDWGTKQANWDDKRQHGTATCGERNATSLLTDAQVLEMRELHRQKWSYKRLMERFGVKFGVVASVVQRRTRKHLSAEVHDGMEVSAEE